MGRPIDIAEIERLMNERAEQLCRDLFPAGMGEGQEFRVGSLDGSLGRFLCIQISGERAGWWHDFASGAEGGVLELVAGALFRGDLSRGVGWARQWLGVDDPRARRLRRRRTARQRQGARRGASA